MSENKKTKKPKIKKVGRSRYSLILIGVMVVLMAIPLYILGDILYDAYIRTGAPLTGNRYEGDLDPAIKDAQVTSLDTSLSAFEEVEDVSIRVQSSTVKVYLDVKPEILRENYAALAQRAYETVISELPVETYFTAAGEKKQYDLEISVYNQPERVEGQDFIFILLNKNSMMTEPLIQDVSVAKNQEVADRLRYEQALKDLENSQEPVEEPPVEETPAPEETETP